jgi:hypothetical protein
VADFVTFLRDPFDRIVSEYNHFVRLYGYRGTFREFISGPKFRNRQSLFAGGIPLGAYSFIGLQESYAEDMAQLAALIGMEVEVPRVNVGNYANLDKAGLWERQGTYFRSINAQDYAMVERVRAMRRRVALTANE